MYKYCQYRTAFKENNYCQYRTAFKENNYCAVFFDKHVVDAKLAELEKPSLNGISNGDGEHGGNEKHGGNGECNGNVKYDGG